MNQWSGLCVRITMRRTRHTFACLSIAILAAFAAASCVPAPALRNAPAPLPPLIPLQAPEEPAVHQPDHGPLLHRGGARVCFRLLDGAGGPARARDCKAMLWRRVGTGWLQDEASAAGDSLLVCGLRAGGAAFGAPVGLEPGEYVLELASSRWGSLRHEFRVSRAEQREDALVLPCTRRVMPVRFAYADGRPVGLLPSPLQCQYVAPALPAVERRYTKPVALMHGECGGGGFSWSEVYSQFGRRVPRTTDAGVVWVEVFEGAWNRVSLQFDAQTCGRTGLSWCGTSVPAGGVTFVLPVVPDDHEWLAGLASAQASHNPGFRSRLATRWNSPCGTPPREPAGIQTVTLDTSKLSPTLQAFAAETVLEIAWSGGPDTASVDGLPAGCDRSQSIPAAPGGTATLTPEFAASLRESHAASWRVVLHGCSRRLARYMYNGPGHNPFSPARVAGPWLPLPRTPSGTLCPAFDGLLAFRAVGPLGEGLPDVQAVWHELEEDGDAEAVRQWLLVRRTQPDTAATLAGGPAARLERLGDWYDPERVVTTDAHGYCVAPAPQLRAGSTGVLYLWSTSTDPLQPDLRVVFRVANGSDLGVLRLAAR